MSDDLEERKKDTWKMGEVRSSGASSEAADESDSSDTVDKDSSEVADGSDLSDTAGTEDSLDTSDTSDKDSSDTADSSDGADTSDSVDISDTTEAEGETVRQLAIDAQSKQLAVRDLHNVNVYLYESIYRDMVTTFKQLDAEYFQQHGDELSKNKEFFNAVFRAGLNSPQLREELELND